MKSIDKVIVWFICIVVGGPLVYAIVAMIADAMKGC